MNIEKNTPYTVWDENHGYISGMLLGKMDEAVEGIAAWIGPIWLERSGLHTPVFGLDDGGRYCLLPFGDDRHQQVYEYSWLLRILTNQGDYFYCMPEPEFASRCFVAGPVALGAPVPDLMAWSALDREALCRPWHDREWTCASNGRVAIRVPRTDIDYGNRTAHPPNLETVVRPGLHKVAYWAPLPELEREESMMQCPDCQGTGQGPLTRCDCCDDEHRCGVCEECQGEKKRLQPVPVVTFSGLLAWENYERLRALPAVQIGALQDWAGFEDSRIFFRFDGGEGLVLGMKWDGGLGETALRRVREMRQAAGLDREARAV